VCIRTVFCPRTDSDGVAEGLWHCDRWHVKSIGNWRTFRGWVSFLNCVTFCCCWKCRTFLMLQKFLAPANVYAHWSGSHVFTRCDEVGSWSFTYHLYSSFSSSSSYIQFIFWLKIINLIHLSMLKMMNSTTTQSSHAETDNFDHKTFRICWKFKFWLWPIPVKSRFIHAETGNFHYNQFQTWWNWPFWPWRVPNILKLTILTTTHTRHAVTYDFDRYTCQFGWNLSVNKVGMLSVAPHLRWSQVSHITSPLCCNWSPNYSVLVDLEKCHYVFEWDYLGTYIYSTCIARHDRLSSK
jgi:hypothetical protein